MAVSASTAPATTPFSRFSRFTLSGRSSRSKSPSKKEEDWYIPYNGPYEPPKGVMKREKIRDSWGQVIDGDEEDEGDEVVLGDKELHARYGNIESERKPVSRQRAQSSFSGRTKSSGTVDPTRLSASSSPRQSRQHQRQPAHLLLSPSSGVGAIPTPTQRVTTPVTPTETSHRISFAQLFSFGSHRKSGILSSPTRSPSPSRRDLSASHLSPIARTTSYSTHPYATSAHVRSDEKEPKKPGPGTAPLTGRFPSSQPLNPGGTLRRASASTPNLRATLSPKKAPKPRLPKGKDKWFSPETWCDALFLPRPRFKLRDEASSGRATSGRIVSPPGSPLSPNMPLEAVYASGVQSRVLAHSRSLVDLQAKPPPPPGFETRGNTFVYRGLPEAVSSLEPGPSGRPKSFALDDLALPSPIPSLSKVLEEGDELERQRKKWHDQAIKSFQNDLSRNVSRHRSRSLGSKGNKHKATDTPLEFLAARTILGAQATMPTVVVSEPPKPKEESGSGMHSHSHKNSLSKTISSLSGISRGHSRDDSWGRTAIRMAKHGAAICGLSGGSSNSASGHTTFEDPESPFAGRPSLTLQPPQPTAPETRDTIDSPVPSVLSDSKVGVAISTPLPTPSETSYDAESLRISSHPYAQGGAYTFRPRRQFDDVSNASRASPVGLRSGSLGSNAEVLDHLASNRATQNRSPIHPYAAQPSASSSPSPRLGDELIRRVREDSTTSPSSKMWAAIAPGVVQEVLPQDFSYSPYMHMEDKDEREANRLTVEQQKKKDRVSVGEALTLAMFSGSRGISMASDVDESVPEPIPRRASPVKAVQSHRRGKSSSGGSMRNRIPVQYDATRPMYQQSSPTKGPTKEIIDKTDREEEDRPMMSDQQVFSESPKSEHSQLDSSPQLLPNRPIGPVDDLDSFRDLFFKPGSNGTVHDDFSRQSSLSTPITWTEGSLRSRRSSGLTQLARQLSQDFEDMRSGESRQTTGESNERLQFVLSDRASDASSLRETRPLRLADHKIHAFQPSSTIPEDVEASSLLEPMSEEGSDNAHLRMVDVHAVASTPTTHFAEHRNPEHLSFAADEDGDDSDDGEQDDTIHTLRSPARLQLPSQYPRDSYMTSSTGQSRMSGLSDFPAPPEHALTPAHASILEAFFDEIPSVDEVGVRPSLSRRPTFGGQPDTFLSP